MGIQFKELEASKSLENPSEFLVRFSISLNLLLEF